MFKPKKWSCMHVNNITRSCFFQETAAIHRSQWKPRRYWSIPSYQVAWITETAYSTKAVLKRLKSVFNAACNLLSKLAPRLWPNISQSILHPHLGNRGESPFLFCGAGTPHHTTDQDTSLRSKKLLRTDRVVLPAPTTLHVRN